MLVIGANYHVSWQSNKAMRFVLKQVDGSRALLATRTTHKLFWVNVSDLIEINTPYNKQKKNDTVKIHNLPTPQYVFC